SLIKYCEAGNRLRNRYITSPESEESIEVKIAKRGTLFNSEKAKLPPKEMEATIQTSQMDVDKEDNRTSPEVSNIPQERHIWRMPEFPPIPQGLNHFQVAEIEIYQFQYKNWLRAAKEEEWEICPSLWQGPMNSYLHIKSVLGEEKTIELLGGWSPLSCKDTVKKINNWLKNQSPLSIDQEKELEMNPALETEGPVASTSSRSVQRQGQRSSEEA
ncbi:hypothetical protein O181_104749, partial [Austropuccinia psidii MF-1]|nr:hypothetical protein [Austropuccinia psidii MF-1]